MTSDSEIISAASEGAAKGLLQFSKDQIENYIKKFNNKELAFIEDDDSIEMVKIERTRPEREFYKKYVKDKKLLLLIDIGLILRKLEKKNDMEKIHSIREKLVKNHGTPGLAIAEFVQRGILTEYSQHFLKDLDNDDDISNSINEILTNIEKYVCFITDNYDDKFWINLISQRINANLPKHFIIFSRGSNLNKKAEKILTEVQKNILEYDLRTITEGKNSLQKVFFLTRSQPGIPLSVFV